MFEDSKMEVTRNHKPKKDVEGNNNDIQYTPQKSNS